MSSIQFKIKRKNHAIKEQNAISEFLKNSQFTDVKLVAEGGMLDAHRVILASASTYFHDLFLSNPSDIRRSEMYVIDNISFVDLQNIVYYIYYGELTVNCDNLPHFIKVCDIFGIKDMHELEIETVNPKVRDAPEQEIKEEPEEIIENVEIQAEVDVVIPGPSKMLKVVRSASKSAADNTSLIDEDEKLFLAQLNLVSNVGTKTRPKPAAKKPLKRLIIKLPRSARHRTTIEHQKFECRFCSRSYNVASSLRNHEKFCIMNDNRSISICNICKEEVPPGSMTFHKKRYHDIVPQSRRMTVDVEMLNADN